MIQQVRQGLLDETFTRSRNVQDFEFKSQQELSEEQHEEESKTNNNNNQPSSIFLERITGPLTSTLRNILNHFERFITQLETTLDSQLQPTNNDTNQHLKFNILSLFRLYLKLRPWRTIFESSLVGLTQTHLKVLNSFKDTTNVEHFIPLFKSSQRNVSSELQDYLHHIHISSMINQLTTELNHLHLLSTHISTVSSNSPLQFLGKSTQQYNPHPILKEELTYQDIYLPCLISISQGYLKYLMTWIFQNDKKSNSSLSSIQLSSPLARINRSYSSYSKFGGVSYEYHSNITKQNHNETLELRNKLKYLPSVWTPLLTLGLITKVNRQMFLKQTNNNSYQSLEHFSQLR